ncbi:MAG: RloB family protein [Methanomassiliicoccales archaeon]
MVESLARRDMGRKARNRVLIITEGTTEKRYFSGLKERWCNVAIFIPKSSVTDAENIVRFCKKQMDHYEIEPQDGDLAMCVFDFDNNTDLSLRRAAKIARENNILLAVSNPCFELWIAMHFRDIERCVTVGELITLVEKYIKGYSKSGNYNRMLVPLLDAALTRADRLWEKNAPNECEEIDMQNPSTNVHIAVRSIISLKSKNRPGRQSKL